MFDFEKLDVYNEIKILNQQVLKYIFAAVKDLYLHDQWKRATINVQLHLAEGTGRINSSEKKHFYTIARSSVFECVALMDICSATGHLEKDKQEEFYAGYEKVSKMLLGMYRNVV
jgi:four helix bundle protein